MLCAKAVRFASTLNFYHWDLVQTCLWAGTRLGVGCWGLVEPPTFTLSKYVLRRLNVK